MKTMFWKRIVIVILCALGASAGLIGRAAESRPVPPPGRLLNAAPAFSQWMITYSYPDERKAPAATAAGATTVSRTKTLLTTKTGDIVHEEIVDNQGKAFNIWHAGAIQYRKRTGETLWEENRPSAASASTFSAYAAVPPSGFRDLDWIRPETYLGKISLAGTNCLVFSSYTPPGFVLSGPDKLDSLVQSALINAESRLPVQTQIGGVVMTFKFMPPPTAKLNLPDDLLQQIKHGEEAKARLIQPASRPN